jgi:hypothetical protein
VFAPGTRTPVVYLVDRHGDSRTGYLFRSRPPKSGDLHALATGDCVTGGLR